LTFCRIGGYKPALAWTCCEYAESLLDRNQYDGLARASDLLDESMSISLELGMEPVTERVLAIQERTASSATRALVYPDGLTQREVEVLKLVATGKTDREIATSLVIAVRTVGTHVGNILNKTGAGNRTEAANYANQHGLA
jgi:DNA-binding NarL/FixJ family response regulator